MGHFHCSLGLTMILVLILVFNILASSQAKPATNLNIQEASITMGENENGKGDYQNDVNQGPIRTGGGDYQSFKEAIAQGNIGSQDTAAVVNRQINRFRHGQPGTITRPLPRPPQNRCIICVSCCGK